MDTLNEKEIRVLRYLVETAEKIQDSHRNGEIYYDKELSSTAYGWHNTKFPPEYREYILTKRDGEPKKSEYDFYYLFMNVCEMIYGSALPFRLFLRGETWKLEMEACMIEWDNNTSKVLLKLIRRCTCRKNFERIKTIEDLEQTSEWIQIQQQYKKCVKSGK